MAELTKYYVDGNANPLTDLLDFDVPVGIYLAEIADELIAAKDARIADLESQISEWQRRDELHGAYARQDTARLDKLDRYRRAVEWCLRYGAVRAFSRTTGEPEIHNLHDSALEVPAEFAEILKPRQV